MTRLVSDFVFDNDQTLFALSMLLLLVGSVAGALLWDRRASIKKYLEHRREVRIQRGIVMGRKKKADRQAYVKGLLADTITNGLEEAWFAGKITAEERNACYRMIGKTHNIPDLIPVATAAQVKSIIKGRRAHGINTPAQEEPWLDGKPEPPKSGDQPLKATNVINAAKKFGDKALSRLKKSA